MNKPSQTILLLLVAASLAVAGTTTVDFTSLALPVNINNGVGTTINGVGFLYSPGGELNTPPPSNCVFDAGLGGTQFFDLVTFPGGCVGAHVDASGMIGTTDGSYLLDFHAPIWNLFLAYGIFSNLVPAPAETDFSINALLYSGPDLVGIASSTGSGVALDTALFYAGPFDAAILTFTPDTPLLDGVPQTSYGLTLGQVSEVTFSTPEPDALWLLLIGLAGIGANKVIRRRA